jgi:plastocyanin
MGRALRRSSLLLCSAALAVPAALPTAAQADEGYGTVKGRFVLEGDVPAPKVIVAKGDAKVKDASVCAAQDLLDNSLVVDPKTKGIANVVVYLRSVDEIHPELEEIPAEQKEVVFDQKNCVFKPHVLPVRAGQTVVVKSDDPVPHNTHTHPFVNPERNFALAPNDRKGVPIAYDKAEFLPVKVNCDLHPHMTAYWVVVDHPYFAVTDAEGRFEIKDLPEGEYDFIVWHERVGYVDKKVASVQEAMNVEVFSEETNDVGDIAVPAAALQN